MARIPRTITTKDKWERRQRKSPDVSGLHRVAKYSRHRLSVFVGLLVLIPLISVMTPRVASAQENLSLPLVSSVVVEDSIDSAIFDGKVLRVGIGTDQRVWYQYGETKTWIKIADKQVTSLAIDARKDGKFAALAAIGTDKTVYSSFFTNRSWGKLKSQGKKALDIDIAVGNGDPLMVAIGTDQRAWTKEVRFGSWSRAIGGGSLDQIEAASDGSTIYVAAVRNNDPYVTSFDGQKWSGWKAQGGKALEIDIAAGDGGPLMVVRGTDEQAWTKPVNVGSWSRAIGGGSLDQIEAASDGSTIYVAAVRNNDPYVTWFDGQKWSGWKAQSGKVLDIDIVATRSRSYSLFAVGTDDGGWAKNSVGGWYPISGKFLAS